MPDIKAIQTALARRQTRRLAFLRSSPSRPDRGKHPRSRPERPWSRAAGFISSRRRASRASWSTESSRARWTLSQARSFFTPAGKSCTKLLPKLLSGSKKIAMQYSPENNIPYIGLVDAGTIELIRKLKKKVVSSADLVQKFEASWSRSSNSSRISRPAKSSTASRAKLSSAPRNLCAKGSRSPNLSCSNGSSNNFAQMV